ncbi:MAG: hypothetical protein ACYDEP_10125 [Acidimicrobiales bacterium]
MNVANRGPGIGHECRGSQAVQPTLLRSLIARSVMALGLILGATVAAGMPVIIGAQPASASNARVSRPGTWSSTGILGSHRGATGSSMIARTTATGGYDLVGSDGGVFVFGQPHMGFYGSLPGIGVHVNNIVGIVASYNDQGYFLVGSDGGVFAFGDTFFAGSLPGIHVHVNNIVGIVASSDDKGYFLVGSDGGVFGFGDAHYEGSLPGSGITVNDVIGIAATPTNAGYWMVENNGMIWNFGDALAAQRLVCNDPNGCFRLVGIAATNVLGQQGFWIVDQAGDVFNFGNAGYFGNLPNDNVNVTNIVSLVPTADDGGYWMIGSDGGVFGFGDASYIGSLPSIGVHVNNIVGAVPTA